MAGEEHDQRERAFEPPQRLLDRLLGRRALAQIARHHQRDDFGVGLALEGEAEAGELGLQRLEILDDAVMDDGDFARRDRMRVALRRHAMRRPARMADADMALHRLTIEQRRERRQLALGPAALDRAVDQGRDAGRIIAAIFQRAPQPVDEQWRHFLVVQ